MGAIRTLHAWAGTALSILAVVLGLTGSLLVFEDDWIRATVPAARAEIDLDAARLGAALDRLEAAEPRLTSVVLPGGAVGVHRLYLAEDGFGYADPDGKVVDRWWGPARAETWIPEAIPRMVVRPAAPGKPATIRLKQPGEWHPNGRTTVTIDPATSRAVATSDANALPTGVRAYNAFYPLHASSVGGWLYSAVTALSGVAMAALGVVGAWAFLGKPRRRSPRSKPTR